jgi:hypothetical protein
VKGHDRRQSAKLHPGPQTQGSIHHDMRMKQAQLRVQLRKIRTAPAHD